MRILLVRLVIGFVSERNCRGSFRNHASKYLWNLLQTNATMHITNEERRFHKSMKLKDYEFGFADATKEYSRKPEIFENAFCDTRNYISKLIDSYEFLLIGRKGVGKTAYSSRLQSIADKQNLLHTFSMNLNDFEFSTFAKTGIDDDVIGTQKYKTSWDFLLLMSIYKVLYNELQMTEFDEINRVIYLLDMMGFSLDDGYKSDITKLSKIKVGTGVATFDVEFEKEFKVQPKTYLERISVLTEKMLSVINNVYLNERKVLIIIDGLDDILRYKKNKLEIIASLVRSADYINDTVLKHKRQIKILILIREDILSMVNDPDLNKIIQDGALYLNWNDKLDDLRKLVNLRFGVNGIPVDEANKCWDLIFPPKIRNKKSWEYVLDYTLYKPRDVLQFLKYCQMTYPDNEKLSLSETLNVLKIYSNKYFIEEMKNELAGFIEDDLVSEIPTIFRKLGGRAFSLVEIQKLANENSFKREVSIDETKMLLMHLFEAGYIGQLLDNGKGRKRSVIFKYRNPTARIDYYQKFITHQGLHSGLGVRL